MAQLHRMRTIWHSCRMGTVWHSYGGHRPYGTAIGWGLYCTATEATELSVHLRRMGTAWHSHRTGTVWHSYRRQGPYGTAMGDTAHMAQPHRTGTTWHSYWPVAAGRERVLSLAAGTPQQHPPAPCSGRERLTQPGHAVPPAPASPGCRCLPSSLSLYQQVVSPCPPAPCPPSVMGVPGHVPPLKFPLWLCRDLGVALVLPCPTAPEADEPPAPSPRPAWGFTGFFPFLAPGSRSTPHSLQCREATEAAPDPLGAVASVRAQ